MSKVARGTALRIHIIKTRFEKSLGGRPPPDLDVVAVRKALRTDRSVADIAADFNVSKETLARFIRQRNLCNLQDRMKFIIQKKHAETP